MKSIIFRGHEIFYDKRPEFWDGIEGWEPETFDVLDQMLLPADNRSQKDFLDIGAWNGVLSIYAHLLGAYPIAIEPDNVAYVEMWQNFLDNGMLTRCGHLNIAISDSYENVYLKNEKDGFGNSMSSVLLREGKNDETQRCDTMTLQGAVDWTGAVPALIKIDTEGAETVIIPSSINYLKQANCPLLLSLHPQWFKDRKGDTKKIMDALEQVYSFNKTVWMIHDQYLFLP